MAESSTESTQVVEFRQEIQRLLQRRLLEAVEVVLEEELDQALGAEWHERTEGRRGYRHGSEERRITTAAGTRSLSVPRGRLREPGGSMSEFRSQLLPRYARRTREIDEAILAVYLAGANSRRIRKALAPLLGGEHLSKSAISRVVGRLKEHFATWQGRDLSAESYPILFLDGFHLKVRMARRVVTVPVLAALGVRADGQKVLLELRLAASEAGTHWQRVILDLQRRGLPAPELVVIDGHAGLGKALEAWPGVRIQRCVVHKGRNLAEHCPAHARGELRRDYHRIVYAKDGLAARAAYAAFLRKWERLCPPVARSLEEAGEELLTIYEFPRSMWKALRSTNAVENLQREFRRRTKTQAAFTTELAALTLLYGLVAFGQIQLRKLDGYRDLAAGLAKVASTRAA